MPHDATDENVMEIITKIVKDPFLTQDLREKVQEKEMAEYLNEAQKVMKSLNE